MREGGRGNEEGWRRAGTEQGEMEERGGRERGREGYDILYTVDRSTHQYNLCLFFLQKFLS